MVEDILEDIIITMAAATTVAGVVLINIHRIITINLILGAATAPMASTGTITMDSNPVSTHGVLQRQIIPLEHLHIIHPKQVQALLEALLLMVVMTLIVMMMVVQMVPVAQMTRDLVMDLSLPLVAAPPVLQMAVDLSHPLMAAHPVLQTAVAAPPTLQTAVEAPPIHRMAVVVPLILQTAVAAPLNPRMAVAAPLIPRMAVAAPPIPRMAAVAAPSIHRMVVTAATLIQMVVTEATLIPMAAALIPRQSLPQRQLPALETAMLSSQMSRQECAPVT